MIEPLIQEILMRQYVAEMRQNAARQSLAKRARPLRPQRSWGALVRRVAQSVRIPRLRRLIERAATS